MKVLILSYHFPPHNIVGSRRWAKFAKYLARAGHQVSVITSKPPRGAWSPWDKDVENKIQVHRIAYCYPRILDRDPRTLIEKIWYKISEFVVRSLVKGTPYDRAVFWRRKLFQEVFRISKEKGEPNVIFATGPPFRVLYYAVQLKKWYPKTKIVCDFRDPWTWWFNMGYSRLKPNDRDEEERMEAGVISKADRIIVPTESMESELHQKYPLKKNKISVIPHGFDAEQIHPGSLTRKKKLPNRFVYYGTLYRELEIIMTSLGKVFRQQNGQITLDVYSFSKKYQESFTQNGRALPWVNFLNLLPEGEMLSKLSNYDVALLFTYASGANEIGTKFYEIIHARIPILFLGAAGAAAAFIEDNHLGWHLQENEIEKELPRILSGERTLDYNFNFNTSPYAFDRLTEKLLKSIASE